MRIALASASVFFCGPIAQAQAPAPPAQFEVAAIKPSSGPQRGRAEIATPLGCRGGPSTSDPGRLSCREPLATLVTMAYQLKPYQFTPPDWMRDSWFEIEAKIPAGPYALESRGVEARAQTGIQEGHDRHPRDRPYRKGSHRKLTRTEIALQLQIAPVQHVLESELALHFERPELGGEDRFLVFQLQSEKARKVE